MLLIENHIATVCQMILHALYAYVAADLRELQWVHDHPSSEFSFIIPIICA